MAGPWENYQAATESAPWEKYAGQSKAKYATGGGPGKFHNPTEEEKKQAKSDIENRPENTSFGLGRAVTGIEELTGSTRQQNLKRGIHDLIVGGGEMALPFAAGAAIADPVAAGATAAAGYAGSKLAHKGAKMANASNDTADLVSDAGGILSGAAVAKIAPGFIEGFREEWEASSPQSKAKARGASAPWRQLPTPATPAPKETGPITSQLPSGRTPGGISDLRTVPEPKPASTADKLPRWHMIRGQAKGETPDASGIPGELPSGRKVPVPGSRATVNAPKADEAAKSAAELMKTVGIGPDEILKATPEQWKMIEQQVGLSFDHQQAIEHLKSIGKEAPKPSPKADLPSGPKTAKPSPGGAKVESTVTPEARAARADEHATKLAQTIRKTLAADKIPESGNDAAWKVLEDQTGTEATPAVRKAAIEKAQKLWSEGPRSAGDLQKRRAEHFAKTKAPASSSE